MPRCEQRRRREAHTSGARNARASISSSSRVRAPPIPPPHTKRLRCVARHAQWGTAAWSVGQATGGDGAAGTLLRFAIFLSLIDLVIFSGYFWMPATTQ